MHCNFRSCGTTRGSDGEDTGVQVLSTEVWLQRDFVVRYLGDVVWGVVRRQLALVVQLVKEEWEHGWWRGEHVQGRRGHEPQVSRVKHDGVCASTHTAATLQVQVFEDFVEVLLLQLVVFT